MISVGARRLRVESAKLAVSLLLAGWVDMATTWNWVLENDWAGHVSRISCSVAVWVVVPLAAGVLRILRRDVG